MLAPKARVKLWVKYFPKYIHFSNGIELRRVELHCGSPLDTVTTAYFVDVLYLSKDKRHCAAFYQSVANHEMGEADATLNWTTSRLVEHVADAEKYDKKNECVQSPSMVTVDQ